MSRASRPGEPIFVGGTGRSGTTIVGELVGARRDVALIPFELRFHVDPGGLWELAESRITVDQFARRMRRRWWERTPSAQGPRGVGVIADRPQFRRAIGRLRERHPEDAWAACGAFMDEMIRPFARRNGATTWAEMTPPNANRMDSLCRMFPDARIVHMVRDGRDVAASVAASTWGPDDLESALVWWTDRMIKIDQASRAADALRVATFRLESLVGPRREEEYRRLVGFLGRKPDPGMRAFFETRMAVEHSHPHRWRSGLDAAGQARIDELYQQELGRLADNGVILPPVATAVS